MMRSQKTFRIPAALTLVAGAALLAACGGSDDNDAVVTVQVGDTVALTASSKLMSFNRAAPGTTVGTVTESGLASGETLLGIDYRPVDGQLYGVGSSGKSYTVDPATGAATVKATLVAAAGDDNPFSALAGTDFGVDFNPAADRLRVVSKNGQILRINVDTGDTLTAGAIAPASGTAQVSAAASAGFDIAGGGNGLVLAALRADANGPFTLYTVSLATGAATLYRNTSGDAALSLIGGASGPALIDLAIRF